LANLNNAEQFKESFREEAREVLIDLEAALLELNENRADAELVGRVFRALHTIKGSGSMFGFEVLAAFTHNLENAFDEVRNGRLEVDSELIDLTLSALDQIRAMLEERQSAAEASACEQILVQLRRLTGIEEAATAGKAQKPGKTERTEKPDKTDKAGRTAGGEPPVRQWAVH
jgi:two-component system chemotaxis sensor kinase CheA